MRKTTGLDPACGSPGMTPVAAYRAMLGRIAGVVVLAATLSWTLPRYPELHPSIPISIARSEAFWGVDLMSRPLVEAVPAFFVSRMTSPGILALLLLAGVVALAFECHRRATAR